MLWTAIEDGYVVYEKMSDEELWSRCQLFGAPRLVEAIENWFASIGLDVVS